MRRTLPRLLLAAPLVLAAAAAPLWGPELLRRVSWFEVQRVEVSGVRLLAPHEVLAASGIRRGQSVWQDPAAWEAALREHPVILRARVTRRIPRTLRIRVEEERPVALLDAGSLRPATAEGTLLPVDPARVGLDLPLLRTAASVGELDLQDDAGVRSLLAETGRLTQLDPGLVTRISELRGTGSGELLLLLSHPRVEVLIPSGASLLRLRQLRIVLDDLESRPAGERPARLDLRFADQVVVRR